MRLLTPILIATVVLLLPATSRAYSCVDESCPTWCGPIEYMIGNIPAEFDEAATVSAINEAMAAWAAPDCTALAPIYLGRTTEGVTPDGMSVIGFTETGWTGSSSSFSTAGPRWNGAGCIVEADIDLNAQDFSWSTTMPTSLPTVNVFSALLRSAGNFYGLGSSDDSTAVMSLSNAGTLTALADDDTAGICALYPEGAPCTDGMCPIGEECVRDVCVSDPCATVTCGAEERCVAGACVSDACQFCTETAECPASSTCVGYPSGSAYCSAACTTDGDCMAGESCLMSGGRQGCVRLVGGTPDCTTPTPPDAGVPDAGTVGADGGLTDGGTSDAGTTGSADAGPTTDESGCSCSAVGTRHDSPSALLLFAVLGFAVRLRRRR